MKPSPTDLITISKAAAILGVSQPTLRRWDRLGRFRSRRHPMSGYRMYLLAEVTALRASILKGASP
jgi:DNA-binding transcriptional MerR regulator